MRARIFRRSGRLDGSSLQGWKADGAVVVTLIYASAHRTPSLLPPYDAEARLLDNGDEAIFADGLRVIENAGLTLSEGDRRHLHTRLFLHDCFDRVGAVVAVHAFDFECGGLHRMIPFQSRMMAQGTYYPLELGPRSRRLTQSQISARRGSTEGAARACDQGAVPPGHGTAGCRWSCPHDHRRPGRARWRTGDPNTAR